MNRLIERLRAYWSLIRTPSDWLCLFRLLMAPVLWVLAWRRRRKLVAAGIVLTAGSDVLDGVLARLSGERSDFGSQFDTVADAAIILSAPGWISLLYPAVLQKRRFPLLILTGVATGLLAVEWCRFRQFGNLHMHSARAAAVVAHVYVIVLFVTAHDSKWLFRLFLGLAGGAAAESAWVILRSSSLAGLSDTPLRDDLLKRLTTRGGS